MRPFLGGGYLPRIFRKKAPCTSSSSRRWMLPSASRILPSSTS
jgi:hypothetical protein